MKKTFLSLLLALAFLLPASAQRTLTGTITDASGEPLPGAAIKVVGSQAGFITDVNGRYEIQGVKFPVKVVISYIGYADTELDLTGNEPTPYQIILDNSKNLLDEVVVVGFGTQKKSTLSGSVGVVDGSTLNQRPVVSAANALQGADPSVYITTSNGGPNSSASINIRGSLSLNGGSPLVLIDGVEQYYAHKREFNKFFKKKNYLSYVSRVNSTYPSGSNNIKTSTGRKVQILLIVDWIGLANYYKSLGYKTATSNLTDF